VISKSKQSRPSELPESHDAILDSAEQLIIQRIKSEWAWQGGELINNLRAYATRLVSYSVSTEFHRLQLEGRNALADLRSASGRALAELGPLRDAYLDAREELLSFRNWHRLKRPARDPAHRWTTFGLLFLLVAIESVLNGIFFAQGSEFGLVGGVGTAVGISCMNVILGFVIGLGPARWINRRNFVIRTVGVISTLVLISALVGLHAFAAHFRDATAAVCAEAVQGQQELGTAESDWLSRFWVFF
jgi:hypothetical protein